MTVCEAGCLVGTLAKTISEEHLDSDNPAIEFSTIRGRINADLTVGANVGSAVPLIGNYGLSWNGMMLAARGFVVSAQEADHLASIDAGRSLAVLKPFRNGGDLVQLSRPKFVIDFFGMDALKARATAPAAYSHLLATVKPERDKARDKAFREKWWLFGRSRPELRTAIAGVDRYIGTTETSKHRVFQFIAARTLPDHMIIAIALDDGMFLSLLSSRIHVLWAMRSGGWLGVGNDPRYSKSRCFDPFPFPNPSSALREQLRDTGEELDALRKKVLAEQSDLTLTGLYNVLEKLKAGEALGDKDEDIKNRGLVLILKELHETIDRLTADAYGWPHDLADEEILKRLVALNAERAREEAAGLIRWLRPDYQIPRFAKGALARTGDLDLGDTVVAIDKRLPPWPSDRYEHPLSVEAVMRASGRPMDATEISRSFRSGGRKIEKRVAQVLESLALYGHVSEISAGRFVARKAA